MIVSLTIQNYILIDHLQLDFKEGFSVFTGETGAGKSIMIDAIGLLCGDRATSSVVRKGAEKAIIEGQFDFSKNEKAKAILKEAEIEENEDVIITREINSDSKSSVRINHRLFTLSFIKNLMSSEIDIHSQHDNQYLLNNQYHCSLLDEYIMHHEALSKLREKYLDYSRLKKELDTALKNDYNEEDVQFFQYEIDEINQIDPQLGEDEELEQRHKKMMSFEKVMEKTNEAILLLEEQGSIDNLYEAGRTLSFKDDEDLMKLSEEIQDKYYELQDILERIKDVRSSLEFDEQEINDVQKRIFDLNRLKRKHGNSIKSILEKREELQQNIDRIAHRQQYLDEMDRKVSDAYKRFEEEALKVSEVRHKKALELEKEITSHLQDLMLPNAQFKVTFSSARPSASGLDAVEFKISMNKGEDLRELAKVASGGELSRLMLGLKTIFTKYQKIQTVIFDEIDTGVSGNVATAIGLKMAALSKDAQVFSVTHLAQVAACGKYHYFVSKNDDSEHTSTQINQLNTEERIRQIAMIATGSATESSLKAAKELFEKNQSLQ